MRGTQWGWHRFLTRTMGTRECDRWRLPDVSRVISSPIRLRSRTPRRFRDRDVIRPTYIYTINLADFDFLTKHFALTETSSPSEKCGGIAIKLIRCVFEAPRTARPSKVMKEAKREGS